MKKMLAPLWTYANMWNKFWSNRKESGLQVGQNCLECPLYLYCDGIVSTPERFRRTVARWRPVIRARKRSISRSSINLESDQCSGSPLPISLASRMIYAIFIATRVPYTSHKIISEFKVHELAFWKKEDCLTTSTFEHSLIVNSRDIIIHIGNIVSQRK